MGDGMMVGMTFLGWVWVILGLALLVGVVLALAWGVRTLTRGSTDRDRAGRVGRQARDELDLRYVRGALSSDDYLQRRADLGDSWR